MRSVFDKYYRLLNNNSVGLDSVRAEASGIFC